MANYLVTGGAGFIGSHFVKSCAKMGNKIIVIDNLNYSGNPENLEDLIDKIYIDGVVKEYLPLGQLYGIIQREPVDPDRMFSVPIEKVDSVDEAVNDFYSSPSNVMLFMGNIIDRNLLSSLSKNIDYVVHFAAETHVDRSHLFPESFIVSDIIGTFTLLEVIKDKNIKKFIHISTDEVYGPAQEKPFDENALLMPTNPYSASKASADRIVHSYHRSYGVPVIILRPSNNYGPYQFPEKFIPLMTIRALTNKTLPLYGDGKQERDWIYVEDTVKAIELLIEKGSVGEIYNISGRNQQKNIEVAKRILSLLGKPETLIQFVEDRPAHDRKYSMDDEKIRKLGFETTVDFEEGLKKTVEWYKNHSSWWEQIFEKNKEFKEFLEKWYKKRGGI